MSLLNAWITPDEALVAVDTDGVRRDGRRVSMSKLFTLPHLNAVLGFRGQSSFSASILHSCASRAFESFDELLDALLGLAEGGALLLSSDFKIHGHGHIDDQLIAIGWSPSRSRMFARTFVKSGKGFAVTDSQGCIAPWDAASMAHLPKTADAVREIAKAQVNWMQAAYGLGGGTLILCKLTRSSVELRHEMTFEREEVTA